MSYNQNDLLQFFSMMTCCLVFVACGFLSKGQDNPYYNVIHPLYYAFKKGLSTPGSRAFAGFIIGLIALANGFYFASIGTNVTNGVTSGFTTSNETTKGWYITGTLLFVLVWVVGFCNLGAAWVEEW